MPKLIRTHPGLSLEDRFWKSVNKSSGHFSYDGTECWEWTASCYKTGYGKIAFKNKSLRSHRISWTINIGPIPKSKNVLHDCDNRKCVRPDHLFIGTQKDNLKDMIAKNRGKNQIPAGEKHPKAQLSRDQVMSIRQRNLNGETQRALARCFNVTPQTIHQIVHRQIWKTV